MRVRVMTCLTMLVQDEPKKKGSAEAEEAKPRNETVAGFTCMPMMSMGMPIPWWAPLQ